MMRLLMLMVAAATVLVLAACQTQSVFKVEEKPDDETVGFISDDILQAAAPGFCAKAQQDEKKRRAEASAAAVIRARMTVIDFLLAELKANDQDRYVELATRIGQFSITRYGEEYGEELVKGGHRVDTIFETLGLRGYVHSEKYNAQRGRIDVVYRIARAGLIHRARKGFTD
jgi:hypothetical protein